MSLVFEKVKVKKIIYYNQQNNWGIFVIPNNQSIPEFIGLKDISVTGNFEGVYESCIISFTAELAEHPKYGKQLQLQQYKVLEDTSSKESIVNFLTKSTISGIHKVLAERIYEEYKEKSIHVVLRETDKLLHIKGIGQKTYEVIKKSVTQYFEMEELLQYCAEIGLNKFALIMQLYKEFNTEAVNILKQNPYQLLVRSESISFNQVDEIAMKAGIPSDDDNRLKFGLLYVLNRESILQGSTGCSDSQLKQLFLKTLGLKNNQLYRYAVTTLSEDGAIFRDEDNVYLKAFYEAENNIANALNRMNQEYHNVFDEEIIQEEINKFDFKLNDDQVKAIHSCLKHQFNVITSLAGCGKTTISKAIIRILKRHGFQVILLAPTAKAAKRLEECTNCSTSTIHRFLKISDNTLVPRDEVTVPRNATILIDEASMVDVRLFEKVLDVAQIDTRIILVGDTHQLPSVQAGNLLEDIIDSNKYNVCYLTDITRQAEGSNIIKYSNRINEGEFIPTSLKTPDFICATASTNQREQVIKALAKSYAKNVEKYGLLKVQVICAYKQGVLGVNNLNKVLKSIVNDTIPTDEDLFPFHVGDKVRHTMNNYELDVFNGEVGVVIDIKSALDADNDENKDILIVDYGDKYVTYDKFTANELTLSYASTIHSSQGSEYNVVYVILDNEISNLLLVRKIVYTAITRAKEKCILLNVGSCVNNAIANNHYRARTTKLKDFITQEKDKIDVDEIPF